jgi:transposase-like protein
MPLRNANLPMLIEKFHNDDACRKALEDIRWPEGVACLKCGSLNVAAVKDRPTYVCRDCAYQFSVTVGTVLQDTKLPLFKWFLATYMICESKKGISSNQLKRTLGITYKSAWFLTHRIRFAMSLVAREELTGIIEADETFVGGKYRYARTDKDEFGRVKRGPRPDSNKSVVLGALARGGEVRMRVASTRSGVAIKSFIEAETENVTALHTDDLPTYVGVARSLGVKHESVNHSDKEYVRGDVTTNGMESVWSLLKRSIVGSFHQLSAKHLDAYLDELEWRFNNRDNPFLFRDTLKALMSSESLEYKELIAD